MKPISVTNLVKQFPAPDQPLTVLDDVSLEIDTGENVAVVGPSGSGKSTFLHIIGTLEEPTSGNVLMLGQNAFELSEPQLAKFRNQNIGFVFQEHHLLPQLSATENVLIPAVAKGRADDADRQRAQELLQRVGLGERLDHRPGQLSGGERQRVAVARALMNNPSILLADEPTGSLDHANAHAIGKLLLDLQKQEELVLVCVTHNDELASWFDRCLRLDNARFTEATPSGADA